MLPVYRVDIEQPARGWKFWTEGDLTGTVVQICNAEGIDSV